MINTIIFDIGNVLLPFDYGRAERAITALGRCDLELLRRTALEKNLLLETGQITGDDLLKELAGLINPRPDIASLRPLWEEIFTPNDPMVDFLRAQKAQGRAIFLLSNIGPIHSAYIERVYPFINEADGRVYSFEEGVMKPDPRIFARLHERHNITPQAALYIDDMPENVAAAESAGFNGFVYDHRKHEEFLIAVEKLLT